MRSFADFLAWKRAEYGARFDDSGLDRRFVTLYESGRRCKVATLGTTVTGTIGITAGWRPCFLLMRTSRSIGSSYLLDSSAVLVGLKSRRGYVAV